MSRLEGRVAVVTGAGGGIGKGIARRFAAEGAKILIAEFNRETGERTAAEIESEFGGEAAFLVTDVREKSDVDAMIKMAISRFGTVDILVNNAYRGRRYDRLERKNDDDINHGLAMNLWPAFWSMQAVFPMMRERGWGRIVNICSLNGVNAHQLSVEYNVSKEALRTLTRTAAREWAPHGICANIICPAAKSEAFSRRAAEDPEGFKSVDAANPMGRMGDPYEDIAPVALFLVSEDCRYVTGNTLFVDGGAHINGVVWAPNVDD
jgi:NAD(P)-dependent dehydrogenase (short-subunit alcohol dehydrogenase family)